MSKAFDVCIRGGGVVGCSLALLLARERLRVALVAPAQPSPALPDIRAYALNGASRKLLEALRVWPEGQAITPVAEMQVWGDDADLLCLSAPEVNQPALAWIVDVPVLQQQLWEGVRYQPQIERVEAPVEASLQVICEGQHSTSREAFGVEWTHKPYAQRAIAARLESDQGHQGVARQWFSQGEVLALLPLSGAAGTALALVWSVDVQRAQSLQDMAPEDFMAALQARTGVVAGQLQLSGQPSSWPLALSRAQRWVGPGWALAGDAAHTVHPLAGQGLNLGLADAVTLAGVLGQRESWRDLGDEKLLRRYARARQADVLAMGLVTDGLQRLFSQKDARWQALRHWGMRGFSGSDWLKTWVARRAAGL